jgi:hypothetical protein
LVWNTDLFRAVDVDEDDRAIPREIAEMAAHPREDVEGAVLFPLRLLSI